MSERDEFREEFEQWAFRNGYWVKRIGQHYDEDTWIAWHAWQAARSLLSQEAEGAIVKESLTTEGAVPVAWMPTKVHHVLGRVQAALSMWENGHAFDSHSPLHRGVRDEVDSLLLELPLPLPATKNEDLRRENAASAVPVTEALWDELDDRGLFNGIDDDIQEEIKDAIKRIVESARTIPATKIEEV
jgi:hypothetical protein